MKWQSLNKKHSVRPYMGLALALILSACASPPPEAPPVPERQPAAALPPEPPPPTTPATLPAPRPDEVHAAITRVYKDTVRVKADSAPGFVVGDFNGDQAQDIAVIVEPVKEKLNELNSDVAAWLLRDPLSASLPPPVIALSRNEPPARPVITANDGALLAVIHGYGAQGWRDAEAQQTYLLKNVATNKLAVAARRGALAAIKNSPMPPVSGDVIKATLSGAAGFLYYNNSSYAWYDPHTYRGEAATRKAH